MFNKKTHINLLILAFTGLAIASMGVYLQITSMDLEKYSFSEYLSKDIKLIEWWKVVVLPTFVGIIFLIFSVVGLKIQSTRKIFLCTLVLSILALPLHVFSGVIGIVMSVTCLVAEYKHNKSFKSGMNIPR